MAQAFCLRHFFTSKKPLREAHGKRRAAGAVVFYSIQNSL
jgi:hypothetical protein